MTTTLTRLAIDGGLPVRTEPFPPWPVFNGQEERLLLEVLHSGAWGATLGEKVTTFETRFAAYQQARFGVCVPNGTIALELGLRALEVAPGDEVIMPAYTFIATATAALALGAKPVFVDIDPETFNIDPSLIEAAITSQTRVILPVHIAGQPTDMDGVMAVARQHGLRVLEDACQAWGAEWRGRRVGALGDLGAFSFQSGKNITAGEGGILVTNDPALHESCWSMHNVGRVPGGEWYDHPVLGWNLRMTEWQGAILLAQLDRLPAATQRRDTNALRLIERLSGIDGIASLVPDSRTTRHAWHLFIFRYDPAAFGARSRDEFVAAFRAEGIPCSSGYRPLTHYSSIRKSLATMFGINSMVLCPHAEQAAANAVWIGQHALLGGHEDVESIVEAIVKIQQAWT